MEFVTYKKIKNFLENWLINSKILLEKLVGNFNLNRNLNALEKCLPFIILLSKHFTANLADRRALLIIDGGTIKS